MIQTFHNSEELRIMSVVVALCWRQQMGVKRERIQDAIVVGLANYISDCVV